MISDYPNLFSDSFKETLKRIEEMQKQIIANLPTIDMEKTIKLLSDQIKPIATANIEQIKMHSFISNETMESIALLTKQIAERNSATMFTITKALEQIDISAIIEQNQLLSDEITDNEIDEMLNNGDITEDDIANEFRAQIYGEDNNKVSEKTEKVKKAIKSIVLKLIIIVFAIFITPLADATKEQIIETFKIDEFWQKTGIIDIIDNIFEENDTDENDEKETSGSSSFEDETD